MGDFINTFRNFVIAVVLGVVLLALSIYISGLVLTFTEYHQLTLDFALSLQPLNVLVMLVEFWIANFSSINFVYNNYFIARIIGSVLAPMAMLGLIVWHYRKKIYELRPYKKKESVHGDARWADEDDVKKANLRSKKGMLLGKDKKGYLIADGYQHALLFAPTGSGKGVGFVIPNLLYWKDSMVVHDIKLENYELTSGWRKKMGQEVYVWSPADPDGNTHCYNPIDWVSEKPGQMVDDVQKIANLIMPKKEFWENEARSLFVGIVLYLIADENKVKSFGEVVRTLRSDDVVYNLAVVLDTMGEKIHPVAYMNIAAFLQKADKERSGVISTANSNLELWSNPLIDTATASSDFNILEFKRKLTTVYVGLTPDNLKRLQPLMQVFYQQATEFLSRKLPSDDEPYGVMFMMDEFPTLGKMEQFMSGIAYFRGYHVRLFLIIQDTQQLKGIYEEPGMNSFLSNSTYRITFAANNYETAQLISQLCGNKTVEQVSQNRPKFLDFNPASRSMSVSQTQRALLLPQEVINLPRDEQILLIESSPPIKSDKIKYYLDPFFKKRLLSPIPIPKQKPFDISKLRESIGKKAQQQSPENQAPESPPDTPAIEVEAQPEDKVATS